jgi:hypothetical protein
VADPEIGATPVPPDRITDALDIHGSQMPLFTETANLISWHIGGHDT